ncbi:hypothetical protein [Acetobacter estunensis]|uniref:hypothetical protein n=1 Tax=Acetobacter estunensis TaxID=104097 RepID=UPI001C2D7DD9|nr:hypothetical protein [Acetobacter estunensis]MBV1835624.1 hypothetical protein [Acetobacter estunensis]MBV1836115.1 hypothetical protein [Acetobacter estunensis]
MTTPTPETVRTLKASMHRLQAQAALLEVMAQLLRAGRYDENARCQILIASGSCVNAIRDEEEAVALQQGGAV